MITTQQLQEGFKFFLNEFPTSVSGLRFADSATKLGELYDIKQVAGYDLMKLGQGAKLLDSICYIPKLMSSVESFATSVKAYDTNEHIKSVAKVFFASIKVAGDAAATMKFFIAMGMTFYIGKKELTYIKNVCSLVSTAEFFYSYAKKEAKDRKPLCWEATSRGCSAWLNAMGALAQYVGKEAFVEAGATQIPDAAWHVVGMLASVTKAVADCKKQPN